MTCREYESHLFAWLDGEVDGASDAAMRGHEAECPDCHGRGAAERRFDERVAAGIVAGLGADDAVGLVRRARVRPVSAPPRRRWRPVRLLSGLGLAAALLLAFSWYACIGPFECPYLLAAEEGSSAPPAAGNAPGFDRLESRVQAPERILGLRRADGLEPVHLDLMGMSVPAVRARYVGGPSPFSVVWTEAMGMTPSWRREVERDGETWWIAPRSDATLVAFLDARTQTLCTVISSLPEAEVYRVARALRHR